MGLDLREAEGAVTLRVRVQPRAAREALEGVRAGALVVRLTAPPVEGAANTALQRLLGRALGVAPSRVLVLRGASAREKTLRVSGVTADAVRALAEPQQRRRRHKDTEDTKAGFGRADNDQQGHGGAETRRASVTRGSTGGGVR